jgi:hypothetical protein
MQVIPSNQDFESKPCNLCKIIKPLTEFNNRKESKDGKNWRCRDCVKLKYKPKSKEKGRVHTAAYAKRNPEKVKESYKKYYVKNKDAIAAKRKESLKNPEIKEMHRQVQERHKKKRNATRSVRRRACKDPKQKMANILRGRFQKVIVRLKKGTKLCSWRDLIGCTLEQAKIHIEQQFTEGMSWENHGNGENKWNVDHIKPLHKFDLTDIEEQRQAFHYTNIRPLWFIENIKRKYD